MFTTLSLEFSEIALTAWIKAGAKLRAEYMAFQISSEDFYVKRCNLLRAYDKRSRMIEARG